MRRGRPSVFRGKDKTRKVSGFLTPTGLKKFDSHRKALAKLAKRDLAAVSEGDVIEALARGPAAVQAEFAKNDEPF